jgi:hypothetical protein
MTRGGRREVDQPSGAAVPPAIRVDVLGPVSVMIDGALRSVSARRQRVVLQPLRRMDRTRGPMKLFDRLRCDGLLAHIRMETHLIPPFPGRPLCDRLSTCSVNVAGVRSMCARCSSSRRE